MNTDFEDILKRALKEDIGSGDITTSYFLPKKKIFSGTVIAKEDGIICGTAIAKKAFELCSKKAKVRILIKDGTRVLPGKPLMKVTGDRGILTAERVALNFLQRLSGIATLTSRFVEKAKGTKTKIFDTRKMTPGLRLLEKYAVVCGGGANHRIGLYDAVLIKDNHLEGIFRRPGDQAIRVKSKLSGIILTIRKKHPGMTIEMEAQDMAQVMLALSCGVDILLLDNMPVPMLKKAIALVRKLRIKTEIEISGGVNLAAVGKLAKLNPDRISVGQLTHSAKALDLSFELQN